MKSGPPQTIVVCSDSDALSKGLFITHHHHGRAMLNRFYSSIAALIFVDD